MTAENKGMTQVTNNLSNSLSFTLNQRGVGSTPCTAHPTYLVASILEQLI